MKLSRFGFAVLLLCGLNLMAAAQEPKSKSDGPAQCAALPCIVASTSVTDQTTPVSEVALVTPTTSGVFRVTAYIESSAVDGSQWGLQFKYTDDLRGRSEGLYQIHPGDSVSLLYSIRDIAGQPITYTVSELKNWTGGYYNLFITVEQIQ